MKKVSKPDAAVNPTAEQFMEGLQLLQSDREREKILRYFKTEAGEYGEGDEFMGVRMGEVFDLAKANLNMPLDQVEILLENSIHEARVGAVSIMDFQARQKKTDQTRRKELFDLYIRRHDRINNWDLVDRSAPHVVGQYLYDKPRDILYRLAVSANLWERRTAIVSTYYFIKNGQVDDTFRIAELLLNDPYDIIHKATGSWLRTAGGKDGQKLRAFLDKHATSMPRVALRYALEHFDKAEKEVYMKMF